MFGIFNRHKVSEPDPMDAEIERGFRALDTAAELLRQHSRGELPPFDIVEIGDGFYVEQRPDGSRRLVVLDKSKAPPPAHLENYVAHVDGWSFAPPDQEQLEAHKAKLNAHMHKVDECMQQMKRQIQAINAPAHQECPKH